MTTTEIEQLSLPKMVNHIIESHHNYLRQAIPNLDELMERVVQAHGQDQPNLVELQQVFHKFSQEMLLHMQKEERMLFPAISGIEAGTPASNLSPMIQAMESEHDVVDADLAQMRKLANDYKVTPANCPTYRALMSGFQELEADMERHTKLENEVLFPRSLAGKK